MADPRRRLDADADLVQAAQAGCSESFTELFRRYYPSVRRACLRRLGNSVDADEAAQAAFVKALERIEQCGGQRRFGAWVHVIAQRLCVDTVRARARTQPEEVPVPVERPSAGGGDPEESFLDQERVKHLQQALSTLSRRQREAVVARAVDDRGPGEIAASLGLSVGAVDSLLLRGRRRLALAYHRVADERGAATAAVTAISAATAAGGMAAKPRRVASGLSSTVSQVQHSAMQLASTVGLLPAGRPPGQGVATAVLTAVLAVHTAAAPMPDADRGEAFATPPAAIVTVRSPVPFRPFDSVGESAVGGSLTALVGGLLDAARPAATEPTPADGPRPAEPTSEPRLLADLAEEVLGTPPTSTPPGATPTTATTGAELGGLRTVTDVVPTLTDKAGSIVGSALPAPAPAPGAAPAASQPPETEPAGTTPDPPPAPLADGSLPIVPATGVPPPNPAPGVGAGPVTSLVTPPNGPVPGPAAAPGAEPAPKPVAGVDGAVHDLESGVTRLLP